jgi:outer membrane protein
MRNSIKIAITTLLIALPFAGIAQQKPLKFGHINKQEVIGLMPERDSAVVKLQKYGKDLEEQLEAMQVEYNKKIEDLKQKEATMSDLVKKTKYEEISGIQTRIQEFQQNAQQEYQQKQVELLQPITEKLDKAIAETGKENGFMYIFDTSANTIPYISSDSQDVAPLVKTKLGIKK